MDSPLFVYGTLKRGFGNHRLLATSEFIGRAVTVEPRPLVIAGLPFMINAPGAGLNVRGECYKVDLNTWPLLDRLEGHPNWYKRDLIKVKIYDNGEFVIQDCWCYMLPSKDLHPGTKFHSSYEK